MGTKTKLDVLLFLDGHDLCLEHGQQLTIWSKFHYSASRCYAQSKTQQQSEETLRHTAEWSWNLSFAWQSAHWWVLRTQFSSRQASRSCLYCFLTCRWRSSCWVPVRFSSIHIVRLIKHRWEPWYTRVRSRDSISITLRVVLWSMMTRMWLLVEGILMELTLSLIFKQIDRRICVFFFQ